MTTTIGSDIAKLLATHPFFVKQNGIAKSPPTTFKQFLDEYDDKSLLTEYKGLSDDEHGSVFNWNTHIGQLKLLCSLSQAWKFLSDEQQKLKNTDPVLLVYIGSAPGTNIPILKQLGYKGKILCIDPNFHLFKTADAKTTAYVGINLDNISAENWRMIKGICCQMDVADEFPMMNGQKISYNHKTLADFKEAHRKVETKNSDILKFMIESKEYDQFIYQDYATEKLISEIFNSDVKCVLGLISDIRTKTEGADYPLDVDVIFDQDLQYDILRFFMNTKSRERLLMYSFKFRCPFYKFDKQECDAYCRKMAEVKEPSKHPDDFSDKEICEDFDNYLKALYFYRGKAKSPKYRYCAKPENIHFQVFPGNNSSETRVVDNPNRGFEHRVIEMHKYETILQNYNIFRMYARCGGYARFVEENYDKLGCCYCWDCSALNQLLEVFGDLKRLYRIFIDSLEISQSWFVEQKGFGLSRVVFHGTHGHLEPIKYRVWVAKDYNTWFELSYKNDKINVTRMTQGDVVNLYKCKFTFLTPVGGIQKYDKKSCDKTKIVYDMIQRNLRKYFYK